MKEINQQKEAVKHQVEQSAKKVWQQRTNKKLYTDAKGVKGNIGIGKNGNRVTKRFKEGLEFAQLFKQLWNKSVQEGNGTVSESLSIELALRSNTAVQKLKDTPYDILDAVDFFLKHGCPNAGRITVAQAVDLHLERQKDRGLRDTSASKDHKNFNSNFKPFLKSFGKRLLISITAEEVEKWLKTREAEWIKKKGAKWSPNTWNSYRNVLCGFWGTMADKNYCSKALNPFEKLAIREERDGNIRPKIIFAQDAEKFFLFLEGRAKSIRKDYRRETWFDLAANVLSWFCGVRSEKRDLVSWDNLDRDAEYSESLNLPDLTGWELSIYANEEKKGQSKILPIPEHAKKWLILVESKIGTLKGPVFHGDFFQRYSSRKKEFEKETGIKIPTNSARHTFASHHLAMWGNEGCTKMRMGHKENSTTLFDNYLTIVKHKKAIPYYGIIPLEVKLNEERQEKVKALAVKISALRKQSNIGQLCWDQNMELQPVQDWEEFDQQHEEYWSRPAGIKYTDDLLLLPDDDKELIKVILPEVKI